MSMEMTQIKPRLETPVTSQYDKYHITPETLWFLKEMFQKDQPKMVTLDSETDGLHIKNCSPGSVDSGEASGNGDW